MINIISLCLPKWIYEKKIAINGVVKIGYVDRDCAGHVDPGTLLYIRVISHSDRSWKGYVIALKDMLLSIAGGYPNEFKLPKISFVSDYSHKVSKENVLKSPAFSDFISEIMQYTNGSIEVEFYKDITIEMALMNDETAPTYNLSYYHLDREESYGTFIKDIQKYYETMLKNSDKDKSL